MDEIGNEIQAFGYDQLTVLEGEFEVAKVR
jgi:hypothetical protein